MTNHHFVAGLLALPCALVCATPAQACSGCGCNLTSDWLSQGLVSQPATTVTLRYDYVPQTQLRENTRVIDRSQITLPPDREIETSTFNHYATLSFDHAFSPVWAVNVQLPFSYRPHRTIIEDTDAESLSRTGGVGDLRLTARYQGFGGPGITGIQFGLKLPTGRFRQTFIEGPATGEGVDRGLQPGTGTVEAVIGLYHFGKLAGPVDFVLQGTAEIPLTNRDLYKPGLAGTISAGVQVNAWKGITPQLQLNLRLAERDAGANSDRFNSGGEQLYVAPGVTIPVSDHLSAFTIAQLPLHQRVIGFQPVARFTISAGLTYRL